MCINFGTFWQRKSVWFYNFIINPGRKSVHFAGITGKIPPDTGQIG